MNLQNPWKQVFFFFILPSLLLLKIYADEKQNKNKHVKKKKKKKKEKKKKKKKKKRTIFGQEFKQILDQLVSILEADFSDYIILSGPEISKQMI